MTIEKYFIVKSTLSGDETELGVIKIADGTPTMYKDEGNNLTFTPQDNSRYRVTADYGGENVTIGEISIDHGVPSHTPSDREKLHFDPIPQEDAKFYGFVKSLANLIDEVSGRN
ncbi:hypothetical protein CMI38_03895 [Candidatus Pacearchaeota archaeon]|jgi:hypothetical protein|nr:hypothetical protein [Candidatus Pacearchaeota archaeon]|tara:strand:- start:37 stop:378 length:342 start_codon:yes stop_codon:yes gene_type:complete